MRGANTAAHGAPSPETVRMRRIARIALFAVLALLLFFLLAVTPPWEIPGGPDFFEGEGEDHRGLRDNIRIGLWWAALLNTGLALALLATLRLWIRPTEATSRVGARSRTTPVVIGLVLLACCLSFFLRLPLASKSLWWDEGWTVRRVVVGGYDVRAGGAEPGAFQAADLRDTFFNYQKPTNHVLFTISAAASTGVWKAATGASPPAFSELAYRLPALLAAVAAVALVAALLLRAGSAHAAVIAAFLMALHPWHVRYGVDGRAYSYVVTGTAASLWFLLRFLETSRFRDVLAYAGCQVFMVWSYPYAAFVTLGTCLAGFAAILLDRTRGTDDRIARTGRFFVAHLLAVMIVVQVLGPNLTQVADWQHYQPLVTVYRLASSWAGLSVGLPLDSDPMPQGFGHPSVAGHPASQAWMLFVMPALVLTGLWLGWRRGAALRAVSIAVPISLVVAICVNHWLGQQFYPRFLVFGLPFVVASASAALAALGGQLAIRFGRAPAAGAFAVAALALGAYAATVAPQLSMLVERPYSPLRDSAEFLGAVANEDQNAIVAGFGLGGWMSSLYEPRVRSIQTDAQLRAICREADRDGRPLFVSLRYRTENSRRAPQAVAWLEGSDLTPVARFAGIEARFHTEIYRFGDGNCPETEVPAPSADR